MHQLPTGRFCFHTPDMDSSGAVTYCDAYRLGLKLASIASAEDYDALVAYVGERERERESQYCPCPTNIASVNLVMSCSKATHSDMKT